MSAIFSNDDFLLSADLIALILDWWVLKSLYKLINTKVRKAAPFTYKLRKDLREKLVWFNRDAGGSWYLKLDLFSKV